MRLGEAVQSMIRLNTFRALRLVVFSVDASLSGVRVCWELSGCPRMLELSVPEGHERHTGVPCSQETPISLGSPLGPRRRPSVESKGCRFLMSKVSL